MQNRVALWLNTAVVKGIGGMRFPYTHKKSVDFKSEYRTLPIFKTTYAYILIIRRVLN